VSDRTGAEEKPMVRLAHEALLRCWPRLVQWLSANREFLRIRARVSEEAKRWQSEGRLAELLLAPGKPLAEGEFLLAQKQELDRGVTDYIHQSHQSAAQKRRRRQLMTAAFVFTLLLGTVFSSYFAWQSSQNAGKADKNAEAEKKARKKADETADANKLLAEKATKSSLEADERREQTETLALRIQFEHYFAKAEDRPDLALVGMASLLPKAARLKDQSLTHLLRLQVGAWSGRAVRLNAICEHQGAVFAVALSADAKTALTVGESMMGSRGEARLWETATGKPIGPPLQENNVVAVAP
jgi:hypothetical protein